MNEIPVLRDYQKGTVALARNAFKRHKHVLLVSATGSGKCLGKDTPILMYNGDIKNVQDIIPGDVIMGNDSTARNVISTVSGQEMLYKIIPTKGDPFICNESHILSLIGSASTSKCKKNNVVNVSVGDYLKWNKDAKRCTLLYRTAIEFQHKDTVIDPWLLGLWLAEGSKTGGNPLFFINSLDVEILNELSKYSNRVCDDNIRGTCKEVSLGDSSNGCKPNIFRNEFRKCLFNKDHHDVFIPMEYKINSRENRLRLLAGLLDGDGYIHNNHYEITTKFDRLNLDILFLCRSLGMAAYSHLKYVNNMPYHRISISGEMDCIPNILTRKKATPRLQIKSVLRTGMKVEKLGIGDYYGFEIDGNHLFVLGDFTVTHNTFMFSEIVRSSLGKGYKVMIVSNRAKLLKQAGGSLTKFGVTAEYISAKHRTIPGNNCIVASAQTLQRRFDQPEYQELFKSVDLWIFDECHLQDFNFLLESGLLDKRWLLGVTATPKRAGKQRQLGLDYEVMVEGLSVQAGIDLKFLVPARTFTLDAPDLSSVSIDPVRGDYNAKDLYKVFSTSKVYGGVISEFKRLCEGEKTMCFCSSQIHAIQTCIELNKAGISSKFVVSGLKKDDEDYNLFEDNQHLTGKKEDIEDEFDRGEFTVLCNVAMYTTGYDCVSIRNIVLLRATLSETLYDQMCGRGGRIMPDGSKSFFRILDFGGNVARHGLYERKKVNSLWHSFSEGSGVVMSKECPTLETDCEGKHGCGRLIHISYPKCCFCGYIFKTKEEERTIELTEIIGGEFKFKNMSATQLKAFAELNGRSMRWVWRLLWIGNNEGDFRKGLRELGYDNKFIYRQMMIYKSEDAKKAKDLLIKEQNKSPK